MLECPSGSGWRSESIPITLTCLGKPLYSGRMSMGLGSSPREVYETITLRQVSSSFPLVDGGLPGGGRIRVDGGVQPMSRHHPH